jgi:hypothetical protein
MGLKKTARRRAERRREARADARLSMRVEGAPDDGVALAQIVTESQNISASGVYFHSPHFLAPFSKVALTLVLPHVAGNPDTQELIKCEGIVVRCEAMTEGGHGRQYELACMFSGLDDDRRDRLAEYVTWRNLQALRAAARGANGARKAGSNSGTRSTRSVSASGRTTAAGAKARRGRAAGAKRASRRSVH